MVEQGPEDPTQVFGALGIRRASGSVLRPISGLV